MVARLSRSIAVWLTLGLALLFSGLSSPAERVEDLPKPTDYVSDFAHVLSPEVVARLVRLCGELDHGKTNTQIAVVTLKNLNGDDKADFANRLEEKWKVGRKGSDRGILMLVSIEDRHEWIEVGYGLEGILPDAKVGDVYRLMVPHLKARDFDGAMTLGVVKIADVIAADSGVAVNEVPTETVPVRPEAQIRPRRSGSAVGLIVKIIVVVLVLAFFGIRGLFGFGLGMFLGGGGRGGWGGGGGGGGDSGGGSGFGGFGGGDSGGGGAGGDW